MMDPFNRGRGIAFVQGDVVFVGEGPDDCTILRHMSSKWTHPPITLTRNDRDVELKRLNWEEQFRLLVQQAFTRRVHAIGLMFDAEKNRGKRIKELRGMFSKAALRFPSKANHVCVQVRDGRRIKTAYLINPAGRQSGSLESLFVPQVRTSGAGECIDELLKCYKQCRPAQMPSNQDKVRVRTYLAYRSPSNTGLSTALGNNKLLSCDDPGFAAIKRFVDLLKPRDMPLLDRLPNP